MSKLKQSFGGLKSLLGGIAVGAGLTALVRNIEEAEKATAQLDAAFKNTGATVGLTRARLDDLATGLQRTTTFSDDLVKEGESILLTFDRVRGEAFERTIKAAADLSTRLGTDLKGSIRQVGLALQDPERGLIGLRRAGISFSESQKAIIKNLLETNQAAKAQDLILSELERRFGGSAAAARNTLGGALAGLKNAFGDLFEGTRESTEGLVTSINGLSRSLSDPKIKEGIDTLLSGFTKLIELLLRGVSAIGRFDAALVKFATQKGRVADVLRVFAAVNAFLSPLGLLAQAGAAEPRRTRGPTGAQRRGGAVSTPLEDGAVTQPLEEFKVTLRKLVDENGDLMRELEDSTKTSVERTSAEYIKLRTTLQFLFDEGKISKEKFNERIGAAQDEILPEFDLNEIRAKYITLKRDTTELGEFMKGVWQGVGRSIQSTISDAIYEWNLSWKSLINIARRALADIASAILTSGISGLFSVGDQSALADSFFAFLPKKAGGGNFDGPTVVGEDGPEIVTGRGRVYNKRQMAFGGGGNITFAPVTKVQIIERDNPERTKQEIFQAVAIENAKQQQEFVRVLQRSGMEVKG